MKYIELLAFKNEYVEFILNNHSGDMLELYELQNFDVNCKQYVLIKFDDF